MKKNEKIYLLLFMAMLSVIISTDIFIIALIAFILLCFYGYLFVREDK
jgi:hypothetical protein